MSNGSPVSGPVFRAAFSAQALTTAGAWDLFTIAPSTASRVKVHGFEIAQSSTNSGLKQDLGVLVLRGSTGSSTGAAITPINRSGHTGSVTAQSSVSGPSGTAISTASAVLLHASAMTDGTYCTDWECCDQPVLEVSQKLNIRVTTPQVAVTVHGTVIFSELGKNPS